MPNPRHSLHSILQVAPILVLLVASSAVGGAQSAPLDLAGALAMARQSGPLSKLAVARRDIAVGRVRELTQTPNPTLEWRRENLGSSLAPDIFVTAYVPIDVTGRRLALRGVRGAGVQRAAADAETERRDAELDVARAWLIAASLSGAQDVANRQYDALREIARIDAERLREGLVSEAVGLRTSLESDRARVALVSATADARRARAQLARVLGVQDDAIPSLAPLSAPTLPVAPDSQVARSVALRARPDVRARELALDEANRRLSAERRGMIGDLQLQGGSKQTSGFMTGQIGVGMPLPLFNRNGGAQQRAAGEASEARILRDDLRRSVESTVRAAWLHYSDVRGTATDAASFDARGREVARIARVAYGEGHISLTELLDAERAASDAMQAHLKWATDAWLARLELERAIGARLDDSAPLDLPTLSSLLNSGR